MKELHKIKLKMKSNSEREELTLKDLKIKMVDSELIKAIVNLRNKLLLEGVHKNNRECLSTWWLEVPKETNYLGIKQ